MSRAHRLLNGWGDTVLGRACQALAMVVCVCWVLPRWAWQRWTGSRPRA